MAQKETESSLQIVVPPNTGDVVELSSDLRICGGKQ